MLFAHIHSHTLRISSFDYAKQRPLSTQHTRTGRGTHTLTLALTHRQALERETEGTQTDGATTKRRWQHWHVCVVCL